MIVELGHFALTMGFVVAWVQMLIPMIGTIRGNQAWMAVARPAAILQFLLILGAFLSLTYAYLVSDFSVANVIANSHSAKPLIYKISGVWGNHEGSMILWVMILTLYGAIFSIVGRNLPIRFYAWVLSIQATIGCGFLGFILLTSNPFLRVDPPRFDGNDLNPLLQDPALALHPPFLYLGYVGFSITFSFALAALIEKRVDSTWARWLKPWLMSAWSFLTLGIGLGSWWAYYTLGWGGWWFWDPVENASLMPWLVATALLHARVVVEKRDALKSWSVLLAIATFALSLIGTFLVRSGILTSVHTFAVDPERGVFILALLTFFIGGALILYMIRAVHLHDTGLFTPISREGALMLNNLLLSTSAIVVFIGTLYPLFLEIINAGRVSVGAPYFNMTFIPLMIPLAIAMTVGPRMGWKKSDLKAIFHRLKIVIAITVSSAFIVLLLRKENPMIAIVGMGLAIWVVCGTGADIAERLKLFTIPLIQSWQRARHLPRSIWSTAIAHAGIGILIAGMTGVNRLDHRTNRCYET